MRVWSVSELNNVTASLQPLVGLRLQEVLSGPSDFVLGFYSNDGLLWLWFDLNAVAPAVLPWSSLPLSFKSVKSPLLLFLRAHFVGRTLRSIEAGVRTLTLNFGASDDALSLEALVVPHRRNLTAQAAGKHGPKKVAWQKPSNADPESDEESRVPAAAARDLEELREQWTLFRGKSVPGKKGLKAAPDPRRQARKDLDKKTAALEKVRQELRRKQDMPWREVGEWLKAKQDLNVPREWEPFVDRKRKLSWNIENAYAKAREGAAKILGTEKRLGVLQKEIAELEKRLAGPAAKLEDTKRPSEQPLKGADAQGRTLKLNPQVTVVAGKSAADNMKILRRARAWDLWMHMRDFPSSHAILFRNKNTKVSEAELQQVAQWFVKLHFGPKAAQHAGEKFELIVAECRHVQPIKGDRIGRVTYRDERNLICRLA